MNFLQSAANKAYSVASSLGNKAVDLFATGVEKTFDGLDMIEQSGLAAAAKHAGNKALDAAVDASEVVLDTALGVKESIEESRAYLFFSNGKLGKIVLATGKRIAVEISADKLGAIASSYLYSILMDAAANQKDNPMGQMASYMLAIAPAVLYTAYQAYHKKGGASSNTINCTATAAVLVHALAPFVGSAGAQLARSSGMLLSGAVGGHMSYSAVGGSQEFIDFENPLSSYAVQTIAIPAILNLGLPAGAKTAKAIYANTISYAPQIKALLPGKDSLVNKDSLVKKVETALGEQISAVLRTQAEVFFGQNIAVLFRFPIEALSQDSAHILVKGLQEFGALLRTSAEIRAAYDTFHTNPRNAQAFDTLELAVLTHLEKASPNYRQLYYALKPIIQAALAKQKGAIDSCLVSFEEQMGFPLVNGNQRQQLEKLVLLGLLSYLPFVIANFPNLVVTPITRQQERGLLLDALKGVGILIKETELAPMAPALVSAGQTALAAHDAIQQGKILIEEIVDGPKPSLASEPAERAVLTNKERIKQLMLFVVLSLFQVITKLMDLYKQGLTFGSVPELAVQARSIVGTFKTR